MHIASDCNELSVPSPCTRQVSQRLVWTYVCMHTHTHTHTINTHDIDKPAHTSTHSKHISPMYTYFCHPSLVNQALPRSPVWVLQLLLIHTQEPNTNICTYMYARTHVHTQRCSVQDHSRVIVELENVYVML